METRRLSIAGLNEAQTANFYARANRAHSNAVIRAFNRTPSLNKIDIGITCDPIRQDRKVNALERLCQKLEQHSFSLLSQKRLSKFR